MTGCLWSTFDATSKRYPRRAAIIEPEREFCFGQWRQRALDYAAYVRRRGALAGDRFIVCMDGNSFESASAIFGILAAGCIPALLDGGVPGHQLLRAIDALRPRGVFVNDTTSSPPHELAVEKIHPAQVGHTPAVTPAACVDSASVAVVLFTSGSSGPPKAVALAHGPLLSGNRAVAGRLSLDARDRILCPVSWAYSYGFGQLLATILVGAAQVVGPNTPQATCEAIERHRATCLAGTPYGFRFLLSRMSPIADTDLSTIRIVTSTGGRIPEAGVGALLDTFTGAALHLGYGLSENCKTSMLHPSLVDRHRHAVAGSEGQHRGRRRRGAPDRRSWRNRPSRE